jgi:uncharacterized protein
MSSSSATIFNLEEASTASTKQTKGRSNRGHVLFSIFFFIVGVAFLYETVSLTQAALYLIGGVLGMALYHARYGFTTSWRNFIVERRGAGIRAQMIMFLIANALFLPLLLKGSALGHPIAGYVSPVGTSLLVGAFLFGIGMQLGDGCASGTLYHIGGGDIRGVLTLIGFVIGSVFGSANFTWWMSTPHLQPISFIQSFGAFGGFLFSFLLLVLVFILTLVLERRRHGDVLPITAKTKHGWQAIFRGPWSFVAGSIVLALGNAAVLLLSGKPWGVTSSFALWGAKVSQSVGLSVSQWGYWQTKANALALNQSIFKDVTTVLDIGVMLGALLAAALAGKFPKLSFRQFPLRMLVAVFFGGIMMGYGARISFGCNIGSYFDGIASFSLHGWVWAVFALIGSMIGVKFRPLCALGQKR